MGARSAKGFTLVELMIVVAIIGILSAVAIPAFTRYVKKSRTVEAAAQLNKMWAGSVVYYATDWTGPSAAPLPRQFPGPVAEWEQATHCCHSTGGFCPGGSPVWNSSDIWKGLNFGIPDAHRYMPGYTSSGEGRDAVFTSDSIGDLDCDDVWSHFNRTGFISSTGDVAGQPFPTVTNELE